MAAKTDSPKQRKGRLQRIPILRALLQEGKWSRSDALTAITIVVAIAAGIVIPLLLTSDGSGGSGPGAGHNQVNITNNGTNNGQIAGTINNVGSTVNGGGLSNDPQGFVNAIVNRNASVVALYLKSGLEATTLYKGASAILFGFQGESTQNGDPVALVKTFQAAGFKVDDGLQDSYLMGALTNNDFPLMFNTDLAPKGYTGGYQGGKFVGSLLFWIVQRAAWAGPTDQDIQVIKYLISQGADCKVPLSFLKYNGPIALGGTSPYEELLPMMQSCAK